MLRAMMGSIGQPPGQIATTARASKTPIPLPILPSALPGPHPTGAIDPAANPAPRPPPLSAIIQASDAQASQRAYRAARSQRSSGLPAVVTAQSSQPVPDAGTAAP